MKIAQNKETAVFFPYSLGLVAYMGAVFSAKIHMVA
jgi:hypothetical protein